MAPEETLRKPMLYRIAEKCYSYNCVIRPLVHAGLLEAKGTSDYNLFWGGNVSPDFLQGFNEYQKTRHFPGCWQLGRKDNLWRNFANMKRQFPKEFEYCPRTYILPEDYNKFLSDRDAHPDTMWITKPAASSCGKGIKLLTASSHVNRRTGMIVSKYIKHPHLIDGCKYDLRVYVCVTSFNPLRIYIYQNGLVRIATQQYSVTKQNRKKYIHLTNYSIQKRAPGYVSGDVENEQGSGNKWTFEHLKEYFRSHGIGDQYDSVFDGIADIVIKTIISAETQISTGMIRSSKHPSICFELFGFDILLDEALKPWLLEVNVAPSLSGGSQLDRVVKTSLLTDTLNLIGFIPYDRVKHESGYESTKVSRVIRKSRGSGPRRESIEAALPRDVMRIRKEEADMLADVEDENFRRGYYTRVFPQKATARYYAQFFETIRPNNAMLWKWLEHGKDSLEPHYKRRSKAKNV